MNTDIELEVIKTSLDFIEEELETFRASSNKNNIIGKQQTRHRDIADLETKAGVGDHTANVRDVQSEEHR